MTSVSKYLIAVLAVVAAPALAEPVRPAITGVSHIAVYSADMARSEAFYTHDLGASKAADPENPAGVRYYISSRQFIEVLPLPADAGKNRLDHVAFATADAGALRRYLAAHHVTVPADVTVAADGSRSFSVVDPEGNRVEFVEAPATLPAIPANPLSGRIIHVGYIIHDRAREDAFFRDVLGFRPYWYGGFDEAKPTWISLQVPEGREWIEYMDIEAAYTLLWNEKRLEGQDEVPKIGRDAKWQLNLYDPDGTRAEIMELKAVGAPCCSPFTADDPE
ncbi:MAG: VOC family protein [Asticcacaulis sp.]|nr:VOC family protein [Asticcacaulis sp.]